MQQINTFIRSVRAEALKLKSTPILWLVLTGGLFLSGFIFLLHFFNAEKFTAAPKDPWILYFNMSYMLVAMLFLIPYVVLIASSIVSPEHNSNSWKYLYALPLKKGNFYFSKLVMILLLLALTYITFLITNILGGYVLDLIFPKYGFGRHAPALSDYVQRLLHSYISIMGIVALHYWFSVRWKSFILPIGIGLLGYMVAIFLVFIGGRFDLAAYFPYAYPQLMGAEFGTKPLGLDRIGWFTKVELYSMALFLLVSTIGFYEEKVKNVK